MSRKIQCRTFGCPMASIMQAGQIEVKTEGGQMDRLERHDSAALTPVQALAVLRQVISRASFYAAINRGEVPHRRLGKRIIIPRYAFMRWLGSFGHDDEIQTA